MFPSIIYDLGEAKNKLPSLQRPLIDRAIAELTRLHREAERLRQVVEVERRPIHLSNLEDSL
jgi:hypothetical protein